MSSQEEKIASLIEPFDKESDRCYFLIDLNGKTQPLFFNKQENIGSFNIDFDADRLPINSKGGSEPILPDDNTKDVSPDPNPEDEFDKIIKDLTEQSPDIPQEEKLEMKFTVTQHKYQGSWKKYDLD